MQIKELTIEEEAPLKAIPDIPYFSENYAWHGYDYETRTGFYAHIGRWGQDRSLWREQLYIYLPDGTTMTYRSVGVGDCSRGAEAGVQKQECITPGKHWVITHRGPIWHHTLEQLLQGPAIEQIPKKIDLRIEFHGETPVFLYGSTDNVTWGKWHYEQMGRVEGAFEFGGRTYRIKGMGFRDHSRGPRKLTDFIGNNWIQGKLPDGTGFALFEVWHMQDGKIHKALSEATLLGQTGIETVELLEAPGIDSLDDPLTPIRVSFLSKTRGRIDLVGTALNTLVYAVSDEHDTLTGAARGQAPFVAVEQPMHFSCDGQIVEGHCERCRPMDATRPALRITK